MKSACSHRFSQRVGLKKRIFPSFEQRLTIQSFDLEILIPQSIRKLPQLRRSALFEPYFGSFKNKPRVDQKAGEEILQTAHSLKVEVISTLRKVCEP